MLAERHAMTRNEAITILAGYAACDTIVGNIAKSAIANGGIDTTRRCGQWTSAALSDLGMTRGWYGVVAVARRIGKTSPR
jgi:hypothetical protein